MKNNRTSSMVLFPLVLVLSGCTQVGRPLGNPMVRDRVDDTIRVHVTNLNFMDATLWAITPGGRKRLGLGTGKREDVFTVPFDFSLNSVDFTR